MFCLIYFTFDRCPHHPLSLFENYVVGFFIKSLPELRTIYLGTELFLRTSPYFKNSRFLSFSYCISSEKRQAIRASVLNATKSIDLKLVERNTRRTSLSIRIQSMLE